LLTAEAVIQTEHPERYLARLGTHAAKMRQHLGSRLRAHGSSQTPPEMQHAEWSATRGTVRLNWGGWTMQATPGTLTLRAEAADQASLQRIQDMLTTRLEKFGRREHLTVTWQQAATPAGEPGPAG
jgi:hypothetical protein